MQMAKKGIPIIFLGTSFFVILLCESFQGYMLCNGRVRSVGYEDLQNYRLKV